jgi:CrcB protein
MMAYIWIGIGGFAGANARYLVGTWITRRAGIGFPVGTLLVNITGALLIGFVLTALSDRVIVDPVWRRLLVIGFLGGYTTFSSYAYETLSLLEQGDWYRALLDVLANNGIGLFACYAGIVASRLLTR